MTVLSLLVAVIATALVGYGVWESAKADARRTAERVMDQLAHTLLVPMAEQDFRAPGQADREMLLAELAPYLESDIVHRVKVWTVHADHVQIVFSDEPRVEGERQPIAADLAAALDTGRVFIQPVPDDAEHRYEIEQAGRLLEAFVGFTDAGGHRSMLELYVPVAVAEEAQVGAAVVLPLALLGLVLLGLALIPTAVTLARRIDRSRREQQDALHYGLAAGELTRRELARKLHDDVLPNLTSAGLLLDAVRRDPDTVDLLGRARGLITQDVHALRDLLDNLAATSAPDGDPAAAFTELAGRFHDPQRSIEVVVAPGPELGDDAVVLLLRVAGELLRNAVGHGRGDRLELRLDAPAVLTVADNGVGFRPGQRVGPGHIGLLLVRRAVEDVGGTVTVTSAPGEGTTVTVDVPPDLRLPRPGPAQKIE
jgi:signal transduction histidine kinase